MPLKHLHEITRIVENAVNKDTLKFHNLSPVDDSEPTQLDLPLLTVDEYNWLDQLSQNSTHNCSRGQTPINGYWICRECGKDLERV